MKKVKRLFKRLYCLLTFQKVYTLGTTSFSYVNEHGSTTRRFSAIFYFNDRGYRDVKIIGSDWLWKAEEHSYYHAVIIPYLYNTPTREDVIDLMSRTDIEIPPSKLTPKTPLEKEGNVITFPKP